jgi:hypothetical protein
MKARSVVSLVISALTLGSCGGRQPVEISPDAQSISTRWNGTLSSPPELAGVTDIRGQAWMAADVKDPNQTRAHIEISNAVPGGRHPWHIHRGQCGHDQGVLGPSDAYKPLKVESNGRASSTADVPLVLPKTGDYSVNVHASARNMSTIVACGNLAPPAR